MKQAVALSDSNLARMNVRAEHRAALRRALETVQSEDADESALEE